MALEVDMLFTLIFVGLFTVYIYPPTEFAQAGLTLENLSVFMLNNPLYFVQYHMQRIIVNLVVTTSMPLLYLVIIDIFGEDDGIKMYLQKNDSIYKIILYTLSVIIVLHTLSKVIRWKLNPTTHPIVEQLMKFCNTNTTWQTLANDISTEILSTERTIFKPNLVTTVIVTNNWVIKCSNFNVQFAHQSDIELVVKSTETHNFSHLSEGGITFVTVDVKSTRGTNFKVRLNAVDFESFKNRVRVGVVVPPNIKIQKSIHEKFVDVFKEAVEANEVYVTNQDLDPCLGCMQKQPEIKLQKLCTESVCSDCYCKPQWCTECMAMWFAHRQDQTQPNIWLSSKCTCPMCRKTFCILDVSKVNKVE